MIKLGFAIIFFSFQIFAAERFFSHEEVRDYINWYNASWFWGTYSLDEEWGKIFTSVSDYEECIQYIKNYHNDKEWPASGPCVYWDMWNILLKPMKAKLEISLLEPKVMSGNAFSRFLYGMHMDSRKKLKQLMFAIFEFPNLLSRLKEGELYQDLPYLGIFVDNLNYYHGLESQSRHIFAQEPENYFKKTFNKNTHIEFLRDDCFSPTFTTNPRIRKRSK